MIAELPPLEAVPAAPEWLHGPAVGVFDRLAVDLVERRLLTGLHVSALAILAALVAEIEQVGARRDAASAARFVELAAAAGPWLDMFMTPRPRDGGERG